MANSSACHDSDTLKALRRRREKPQLSCNFCRVKKLKCDRCQPCQNCSRRRSGESCAYVGAPTAASLKSGQRPSSTSNVRDRIKELENRVAQLTNAVQSNQVPVVDDLMHESYGDAPVDAPVDADRELSSPPSNGFLDLSNAWTSYVGASHWISILSESPQFSKVVRDSVHAAQQSVPEDALEQPDLLGFCETASREAIVAAVPAQCVVEWLIAECFNNTNNESSRCSLLLGGVLCADLEIVIIHPPTFRLQYAEFLRDPDNTPIMWVGLLYALLCLAVQYQQFLPQAPEKAREYDAGVVAEDFREKAIQCLVLGRYTDAPPFAVETLLLHVFIEALRGERTANMSRVWALWGVIVRIAQRAGYHRDGSHFPNISPFQAEMRRRAWALIVQWDMYLSLQFGLPPIVVRSLCDAADPRSLKDEDLSETMCDLPPARLEAAMTVPQYHVAKNRLLSVFATITDFSSTTTHAEVVSLEDTVTRTYQTIMATRQGLGGISQAPTEQTQPKDAATDVPGILLTMIYRRAQIVLHHKYMRAGRNDARYASSRKVCLDAALTLMQHQWTLYLETQAGGLLCRHGWKFLVILVHDFLLGTAVLCTELADDLHTIYAGEQEVAATDDDSRERVFHALSGSYIVWQQSHDSQSSREVRIIVAALKEVLDRAERAGLGKGERTNSLQWMLRLHNSDPRQSTAWAAQSTPTPKTESSHESGQVSYLGIVNFPI